MLVGAYRDNEVSSSRRSRGRWLQSAKPGRECRKLCSRPSRSTISAGSSSNALHCKGDSVQPLAELVHEKTGGNPFFAIQFLTALAEEGLLRLDPDASAWIWTWLGFAPRAIPTTWWILLPVGEVKAIVRRDADRPTATRLSRERRRIATLTLVHGKLEEEIHAALWEATRAGLDPEPMFG